MKFKRLFCPTCQMKVPGGLVQGVEVPQFPNEIGDLMFDVTFFKDTLTVTPTWTDDEIFGRKSINPLRHLATIENYVENVAPSVRCALCRTEIKLERLLPLPPPAPEPVAAANNPYFGPPPPARAQAPQQVNPALRNVVQQVQQQAQASRFATNVNMVRNIFNNSFTEPDLDVILADLDITMPPGSGKPEKLEALIDHLYS